MQVASFLQDDRTLKLASDRLTKAVLDALVSFTTGTCRDFTLCDAITSMSHPTTVSSQSQKFETMDSIASVRSLLLILDLRYILCVKRACLEHSPCASSTHCAVRYAGVTHPP